MPIAVIGTMRTSAVLSASVHSVTLIQQVQRFLLGSQWRWQIVVRNAMLIGDCIDADPEWLHAVAGSDHHGCSGTATG